MAIYIIKKFIEAKSALDAIYKEKETDVDEVYIHEHNSEEVGFKSTQVVGIEVDRESSDYEYEEKKR